MHLIYELKSFFSRREWLYLLVILGLGIFLRWYGLDIKAYHHDESLHAIYGKYGLTSQDNRFYQYNPLLHGPLLYNLYPYFYKLFGISNWTARAPMALLGTLFLFLPFLFYRFFHKTTFFFLMTLWSLSPTMIYWSRYIRHDFLVLSSLFIMVYGIVLADKKSKSFFVVISIFLQFCIKENAYITVALLLGFLIFEYFYVKFFLKDKKDETYLLKIVKNIKAYPVPFILALSVGAFIYAYFYSAAFRYIPGILDGLYRKSIPYWIEQHGIERIKGPFLYHIFFLSWYELVFMIFFLVYLVRFYIKAPLVYRWVGIVTLSLAAIFYYFHFAGYIILSPFWSFFKLKSSLDAIGIPIFIIHSFVITIYHLNRGERGMAIWGYLFMSTLFSYSFVGEKVPWLSLYIYFPGSIYLALFYEKDIRENLKEIPFNHFPLEKVLRLLGVIGLILGIIFIIEDKNIIDLSWPIAAIALFVASFQFQKYNIRLNLKILLLLTIIVYNLKISIITNFTQAGKRNEFISQVHTTEVFQNLALKIRDDILNPKKGKRIRVLTTGASIWPMTWYMRDLKNNYEFKEPPRERKYQFDYIIEERREDPLLSQTHNVVLIPLRSWWTPEYQSMTLKKYLTYAWNHIPWNAPGYMLVTYAAKKDL